MSSDYFAEIREQRLGGGRYAHIPVERLAQRSDFKTRRSAVIPSILIMLLSLSPSVFLALYPVDVTGREYLVEALDVMPIASSALFSLGFAFLILSFFQTPIPRGFKDEFKVIQNRHGRDPVTQALILSVGCAVVWLVVVGLIMGLNSLANGAGIPLMIVWSFVGMAMGLTCVASLVRSVFMVSGYRRQVWQDFLRKINRERGFTV